MSGCCRLSTIATAWGPLCGELVSCRQYVPSSPPCGCVCFGALWSCSWIRCCVLFLSADAGKAVTDLLKRCPKTSHPIAQAGRAARFYWAGIGLRGAHCIVFQLRH